MGVGTLWDDVGSETRPASPALSYRSSVGFPAPPSLGGDIVSLPGALDNISIASGGTAAKRSVVSGPTPSVLSLATKLAVRVVHVVVQCRMLKSGEPELNFAGQMGEAFDNVYINSERNRCVVKFKHPQQFAGATAILYRSGFCVVMGLKNEEASRKICLWIAKRLNKRGGYSNITHIYKYKVVQFIVTMRMPRMLNLRKLAESNVKHVYDPVLKPTFLHLWPDPDHPAMAQLNHTGTVVIAGTKTLAEAKWAAMKTAQIARTAMLTKEAMAIAHPNHQPCGVPHPPGFAIGKVRQEFWKPIWEIADQAREREQLSTPVETMSVTSTASSPKRRGRPKKTPKPKAPPKQSVATLLKRPTSQKKADEFPDPNEIIVPKLFESLQQK
eukprot:TRINITY_DN68067_c0_g3_i3.p1 TRINITY_DN68067_c0_g3~~TRINITY_DN68067_c0_g3_i3.p1  ORF type:complete len:421 (+),score=18.93 TRINITY_DN68067_c0_g3_i3:110-1264(+)